MAGGRETDPTGSLSMLVSNTACLEILPSRRGENSDSPPSPLGGRGDNSGPLPTPLLC